MQQTPLRVGQDRAFFSVGICYNVFAIYQGGAADAQVGRPLNIRHNKELPMTVRCDSTSRLIAATPAAIYWAFAVPGALERWMPPDTMVGTMLHFDFRAGGSYRMRLTYPDLARGHGKTAADADEVEVHLTHLEAERRIEQAITFASDDPAFAGVMRMIWTFQPQDTRTLVTIQAMDVPAGIHPDDHVAGMNASLANLARFVEADQ